ncbi:hypothetical protein [Pseudarthrobacter sp. 1C304]|uniref:hypothetical protein n=1 Tax=Pseudarthrobacter sp. 1C304 TaxID=3457438 RepID=UPI003FD4A250
MSQLQPYPEYKESGAEWLGRIPAEWEVLRIKMSVQTARNGIWGQDPQDGDFPIWCVRVADFDRKLHSVKTSERTMRSITSDELIPRKLNRGDLLLEKSGGGENNPVGFVVRFDHDDVAVCSNFIAKMQLSPGMDSRFWTYVHATTYSVRLTQRSIKQTSGIQNLDQASYFNELAPFPPLKMQSGIADFLDRETAQIDELIVKQERLIELLAEKRQAIITHAVTKGLDSTAPTKPSGIPWLGDVPSHWQVSPVGSAAELIQTGPFGSQIHADDYVSGGTPLINPSHLIEGCIAPNLEVAVSEDKTQELRRHALRKGDVVVARRGELGRNAVVTGQDEGFLCGTGSLLIRLQPSAYLPEYFSLVFGGQHTRDRLSLHSIGATMDNLNAGLIAGLRLVRPPIAEQKSILRWLGKMIDVLDETTKKAVRSIDLLRERRSALISAAVTGKIDVREGAA